MGGGNLVVNGREGGDQPTRYMSGVVETPGRKI